MPGLFHSQDRRRGVTNARPVDAEDPHMPSKRSTASGTTAQSDELTDLAQLEADVRAELEHLLNANPELTSVTLDEISDVVVHDVSHVALEKITECRDQAIFQAAMAAIEKANAQAPGRSAQPIDAPVPALVEGCGDQENPRRRRVNGGLVYDHTPIGTVIRFSDGTDMPPADRPHQRRAWNLFNGTGRLIRKEPPINASVISIPATITLRTAEFGATGAVGLTFSVSGTGQDKVSFEIIELPPVGSVRVLGGEADDKELLFLAPNHHAARQWLKLSGIDAATLELVTADEIAATTVEGRCLAP